jgi:alpha-galactosidase
VIWDCTRTNHGHSLSAADISNRATWNYYKVHETLMKKFPNLLIENCVNGGRMTDFGVIRYSHYTCGNDRYEPMSLRRTFHDLSYMLPPRIIEGYLGRSGQPIGVSREFVRYRLRSTMLGWCTLMMFGSKDWNPVQYDEAKKQFEIYKQYLRPQIREGNLYHISKRPSMNNWDAYEYYTPSKGTGVVYVFRAQNPNNKYTFKLKGLDSEANYELKSQDGYLLTNQSSGKSLMDDGFTITIPQQQWSDLVYITKK